MLEQLQLGDVVYSKVDLFNDGEEIPEMPKDALIAAAGTRGVVVNMGHLEEEPGKKIFLVRFEDKDLNLGPPVGCWEEELMVK